VGIPLVLNPLVEAGVEPMTANEALPALKLIKGFLQHRYVLYVEAVTDSHYENELEAVSKRHKPYQCHTRC
jgi:hypothetical protein